MITKSFDVINWNEIPGHIMPNYLFELYVDNIFIKVFVDSYLECNHNEFYKFLIGNGFKRDQYFLIEIST